MAGRSGSRLAKKARPQSCPAPARASGTGPPPTRAARNSPGLSANSSSVLADQAPSPSATGVPLGGAAYSTGARLRSQRRRPRGHPLTGGHRDAGCKGRDEGIVGTRPGATACGAPYGQEGCGRYLSGAPNRGECRNSGIASGETLYAGMPASITSTTRSCGSARYIINLVSGDRDLHRCFEALRHPARTSRRRGRTRSRVAPRRHGAWAFQARPDVFIRTLQRDRLG